MKRRYYLLLVFIGIAATLAGWIYESRLRPPDDGAELAIPDNIDYYLTNLRYRSVAEDGRLDFEFNSPRLEHRPQTDTSYIETPKLHISRSAGNWQINSGRGEFKHSTNRLRLSEAVLMHRQGPDPLKIRGHSIIFEPDADRVTSESDIVINSINAQIKAEHAVFDLEQNVYRLHKARATYHDDQG